MKADCRLDRQASTHVVFWTFTTLGDLPVDILVGGFDITGLAMDATVNEEQLALVLSKSAFKGEGNSLLSIDLKPDSVRF